MLRLVDRVLNRITMYRLVLYYLIFLVAAAVVLSFFGYLSYDPLAIIAETIFVTAVAWITNIIFARVFGIPTNTESVYITALILVLIIAPPAVHNYYVLLPLLVWVPILAIASKFILAIRKKHVFNPAALAVAVTAFAMYTSASWWVGTLSMAPFVAIGGVFVMRKLQRWDLALSFFIVASATIALFRLQIGIDVITSLQRTLFESPLLFFGFVMLTEPLTAPPTRGMRVVYGSLVGFLFAPYFHIGNVYFTPETALLVGNIFSYIVSPKQRLVLKLKEKMEIARNTYEFLFASDQKLAFAPGQYLEWTLGHTLADSRGNRRYFTIASSPDETYIRLGVKFYPNPSTFKQALRSLEENDKIIASQLAGEFTLPKDKNKKLVFMAGGIGITPYRSMIQHLVHTKEKRDIILIYSNRTENEIAYEEVFGEAKRAIGLRTVYVLTDETPPNWKGRRGFIDATVIQEEVPDYTERIFYLSGPRSMVETFEDALKRLGVKARNIKIDFFPGFA